MKVLAAITNSLLAAFIVMSGITFVANKIADAQYLNKTAKESGVYKGISEAVSRRLVETSAKNLGIPETHMPAEASNLVSEAYITAKSEEVTIQIEEALRGERKSVVIDISDLAAHAQAAGLSVNATDLRPVEIAVPGGSNEEKGTRAAQNLDLLRFMSYIITALLFMASVTLSITRKNLTGLGSALLSSGLTFAVFAIIGRLIANTASNLVELPDNIPEVAPYIQTFIRTIISSAAHTYTLLAATLITCGVLLIITQTIIKRRQRISPQNNSQFANY